jgi:hypothetical protein
MGSIDLEGLFGRSIKVCPLSRLVPVSVIVSKIIVFRLCRIWQEYRNGRAGRVRPRAGCASPASVGCA